jgi:hypothetical protein
MECDGLSDPTKVYGSQDTIQSREGNENFEKIKRFAVNHFAEVISALFAGLALYMAPKAFVVSLLLGVLMGFAVEKRIQALSNLLELDPREEPKKDEEKLSESERKKYQDEYEKIIDMRSDQKMIFMQAVASATYITGSSLLSATSVWYNGITFGCLTYRKIYNYMNGHNQPT